MLLNIDVRLHVKDKQLQKKSTPENYMSEEDAEKLEYENNTDADDESDPTKDL